MKGNLLPEYQEKKYNDFVGTEEVKQDYLTIHDAGQVLLDKPSISSFIVKAPSEHAISICSCPCGVTSTNLEELNSIKRTWKHDVLVTPQNRQASVQKSKHDVELKSGNITGRKTVELVEFTNGKVLKVSLSSEKFRLLSFSSRSIWTLSELFQKDQCDRGALEKFLISNKGSEPNMPDFLESCDSSNSSSSIDDESIEFRQMQALANSSSLQNSYKPVQKYASLSIRNPEKLPKEDKEEVDKFLKGFSRAPFEWISDAEESSYSEDSSFDEEKVSSMPSTDDHRSDAQECTRERDMKVKYDQMTNGDFFSSKIENEDIHMEKKLFCYSNVFCNDKRLDRDSKESYVTENTDWQTQSSSVNNDANGYDDKGNAKQSQGWLDSDDVQAAFHLKERQKYSTGHVVHENNSTLDIFGNADDARQQVLGAVVAVESLCKSNLCESKIDKLCVESDLDRDSTMRVKPFLNSQETEALKVSKNEDSPCKDNEIICTDDGLIVDADNIINSGLYKDDMMLVQKVGGVLAGSHPVHDQDQETLSYVPTADGLVLELCRASTLQKGNHRNKNFDELLIQKIDDFNQGSPAKFQTFPTLQSRLDLESEPARKEPLLDKGISLEGHMQSGTSSASLKSPKVDEGRQVQMMCSMDFSDGTLEVLHVIGKESRSTDLAPIPFSGPISQSALLPFSGSVSLRSDSSNNSTRSFAFPVLASEWNSSPVKMAPADHRYLRRKRGWRFCCFGCTKPSTIY